VTTTKECVWDGVWMVMYTRVHDTPIGTAQLITMTGLMEFPMWNNIRLPVIRIIHRRLRRR